MKRTFVRALVIVCVVPLVLRAQAPERAVFLVRIGSDTLAMERSAVTPRAVENTLWLRTPLLQLQRAMRLAEDGAVMDVTVRTGSGAAGDSAVRRSRMLITGDSAAIQQLDSLGAPSFTSPRSAFPRAAVPYLNLSGQTLELILRRAARAGRDTASVPLSLGNAPPIFALVRRWGRDSASIGILTARFLARTDSAGRLLGAVVPGQNVVVERLPDDSPAGLWRPARVSYDAPPGAPYTAVAMTVKTPGLLTLAGTLTLPARKNGRRLPAVVLITGSGSQDRDEAIPGIKGYRPFREIADTLSRRGIAVLRLDDRGVGGSQIAGANATSADFADDIRAAVQWLRARADIDPARIGLVGHSEGAMIAPMLGATDKRLKALALIAGPASRGGEIMKYQRRYVVEHDSTIAPAKRDSVLAAWNTAADSVLAAPGWAHFFAGYDPLPAARAVRAPVLVLQGETDTQVVPAEARKLADAMRRAGNRRVTLVTFPRMNHLMLDDPSGDSRGYSSLPVTTVRRDFLGVLADWLARTL